MNMNDDNFFDDMQDEIQENDNGVSRSYQDDKNKKTRLMLTVVISFAVGLLLLGILLFFLSGDKDDDMVAINSVQQSVAQTQMNKVQDMNNSGTVHMNDGFNQPTVVNQSIHPTINEPVENKPVIKNIKRTHVKIKKTKPVVKSVKTVKKIVPQEVKPVVKGPWKVQLMSAQDRDNNSAELKSRMTEVWNKLVSENAVLKGHIHDIEQTDIKGVTWYRLRVIGLKNSAEATSLCNDLKSNSVACIIVK